MVHGSQPFHGFCHQVALDGIVGTVTHRDLAVDDWHWVMRDVVTGRFRGGWWVDHVEVVGDIQHVCKAELCGVRCGYEIAEMYTANNVVVVGTLTMQHSPSFRQSINQSHALSYIKLNTPHQLCQHKWLIYNHNEFVAVSSMAFQVGFSVRVVLITKF